MTIATMMIAALPTLSGLADSFATLQECFAETTNQLAAARAENAALRGSFDAATNRWSKIVAALNADEKTRKALHGNIAQQYVLTNSTGRIFAVHLYEDGSLIHVDTKTRKAVADPEAKAKTRLEVLIEQDAIKASADAKYLPAEVAALLAERRAVQIEQARIDEEVARERSAAFKAALEARFAAETFAELTEREKRAIRREVMKSIDVEAIRAEVESEVGAELRAQIRAEIESARANAETTEE